jgi:hypothetical protein
MVLRHDRSIQPLPSDRVAKALVASTTRPGPKRFNPAEYSLASVIDLNGIGKLGDHGSARVYSWDGHYQRNLRFCNAFDRSSFDAAARA